MSSSRITGFIRFLVTSPQITEIAKRSQKPRAEVVSSLLSHWNGDEVPLAFRAVVKSAKLDSPPQVRFGSTLSPKGEGKGEVCPVSDSFPVPAQPKDPNYINSLSSHQVMVQGESARGEGPRDQDLALLEALEVRKDLATQVRISTQIWLRTLRKFGVVRGLLAAEELEIGRAVRGFGAGAVGLALLGASAEAKTQNYEPAKWVSLRRTLDPVKFERFVNLGAQERAKLERMAIGNAPQENPVDAYMRTRGLK